MAPTTNRSGHRSSKYEVSSTLMLLAGGVSHGRLPAVSTRQPGQRPEDPIAEPEAGALKSDLGHAPYIAKAIMLRLGLVLEEFHFDRNAARRWMGHFRRNKPIIR